MTVQDFSDETLVAFADGELDAATNAAFKATLDRDPALAKRLAAFRATRNALKTALGPIERETVPDHLTRFVMTNGEAHSRRPVQPVRRAHRFALPMAAALAFIVAGVGGYWVGARSGSLPGSGTLAAAAAAEPELQRMLAAAPDGMAGTWKEGGHSGEIVLRATYRTRAGICRSFSLSGAADAGSVIGGVACIGPTGWRTQVIGLGRSSDGSIAPAGGAGQAADAFLDRVEAEDPLNAAAVQDLILSGWRR
jgi:surface antigen